MELLPLFLNLTGRTVVLVGGGRVAAGKLKQLLAVGARVRVVSVTEPRDGKTANEVESTTCGSRASPSTIESAPGLVEKMRV